MAANEPLPNAYVEAIQQVDEVNALVSDRIDDAVATSSAMQNAALSAITALQGINFNINAGPIPAPPNIDPNININIDLPPITPTSFGAITSNIPDTPGLDNIPAIDPVVIPEFVSSVSSLNIPEPPPWTAPSNAPEAPVLSDINIPDAPNVVMPAVPALTEITVPTFAGLTLSEFNATAPEFSGTALPGILQWSEPTYHTEILDEVLAVIRTLWSGGSGIPPAVEQAMVERAASREDQIAEREISAVSEEFSLRGFTMPPGMEAARIDEMRQALAIKKLELNRELTIEFAKFQIENIRFGVEQAISAENVLVNIFLNSAQRMFEAARFQIESQINIYNAQVAVFNARMNGYQVEASVFDTKVKAELSKLEVFRAEIEAEVARGQINEQKVRTYTAQVQALQTQINIYTAQMQGAQIESEVVRNRIMAYSTEVQAYGARIAADKTRFEAYESQIKGESAKAGIIDSEARAYAALVQGKATGAEVNIKRAELTIQKNNSSINAYAATLEAEKARIQSQASVIQAGAQAYIADTQRFAAQAAAESTKAQLEITSKEVEMRTNISFYQAQVQAYIANMEQLIRQVALVVDSIKAAGQITSTMAAGAMAGVHVGATLSGGASISGSGGSTSNFSIQQTTAESTVRTIEGPK